VNFRKIIITAFFASFVTAKLFSQIKDYPHEFPQYSFINYDANELVFGSKSNDFTGFFEAFDALIIQGVGSINIVHIGASHIQADMMSGRMRERFYNMVPGMVNSRGFLFPFSIAKTNHPFNYYSDFTGTWDACRNVQRNKICNMGLGGISAMTTDSSATFNIYFRKWRHPEFRFNDIIVLHAEGDTVFDIDLMLTDSIYCDKIKYNGYTQFITETLIDTLSFRLQKTDSLQFTFETYGLIAGIENFSGLTYHAIGINGASVPSYLRCNYLNGHLALLEPHLIILSIGINDAHDNDFTSEKFKANYDTLIRRIRQAAPDAHIIFTTNSDSYIRRRIPNNNSIEVKNAMLSFINTYENCAVWDWHTIMGGLGSIADWQRQELAKKDRIHFTREGYVLSGDLFFSAFIKAYENFLHKTVP